MDKNTECVYFANLDTNRNLYKYVRRNLLMSLFSIGVVPTVECLFDASIDSCNSGIILLEFRIFVDLFYIKVDILVSGEIRRIDIERCIWSVVIC